MGECQNGGIGRGDVLAMLKGGRTKDLKVVLMQDTSSLYSTRTWAM